MINFEMNEDPFWVITEAGTNNCLYIGTREDWANEARKDPSRWEVQELRMTENVWGLDNGIAFGYNGDGDKPLYGEDDE